MELFGNGHSWSRDEQGVILKIDVLPFYAQNLATSQTCCDCKNDDRCDQRVSTRAGNCNELVQFSGLKPTVTPFRATA